MAMANLLLVQQHACLGQKTEEHARSELTDLSSKQHDATPQPQLFYSLPLEHTDTAELQPGDGTATLRIARAG